MVLLLATALAGSSPILTPTMCHPVGLRSFEFIAVGTVREVLVVPGRLAGLERIDIVVEPDRMIRGENGWVKGRIRPDPAQPVASGQRVIAGFTRLFSQGRIGHVMFVERDSDTFQTALNTVTECAAQERAQWEGPALPDEPANHPFRWFRKGR